MLNWYKAATWNNIFFYKLTTACNLYSETYKMQFIEAINSASNPNLSLVEKLPVCRRIWLFNRIVLISVIPVRSSILELNQVRVCVRFK